MANRGSQKRRTKLRKIFQAAKRSAEIKRQVQKQPRPQILTLQQLEAIVRIWG